MVEEEDKVLLTTPKGEGETILDIVIMRDHLFLIIRDMRGILLLLRSVVCGMVGVIHLLAVIVDLDIDRQI